MSAIDKERFPRGALIAAGALVGFSLLAAGFGRYQNLQAADMAEAPAVAPIASAPLYFVDVDDGSVQVLNATTETLLLTLKPGEDAFIRSVMRALVRARRLREIGAETPFILALYDRNRLVIEDPATGETVDLRAFGKTNHAAFERVLVAASQRAEAP